MNLVRWIDFHILSLASDFDRSKVDDTSQCEEIIGKSLRKIDQTFDFTSLIGEIPEEYLSPLSEESRNEIRQYIEDYYFQKDFSAEINERQFQHLVWLLAHICGQFKRKNLLETTREGKALSENYLFVKGIFVSKYPETHRRLVEEHQQKQIQTEPLRPLCPQCGLNDILSKGLEWNCKSCGRRWLKNPRGKKNLAT